MHLIIKKVHTHAQYRNEHWIIIYISELNEIVMINRFKIELDIATKRSKIQNTPASNNHLILDMKIVLANVSQCKLIEECASTFFRVLIHLIDVGALFLFGVFEAGVVGWGVIPQDEYKRNF